MNSSSIHPTYTQHSFDRVLVPSGGISLRDHIAIQSQGSVTALCIAQDMDVSEEDIIKLCYRRADLMLRGEDDESR